MLALDIGNHSVKALILENQAIIGRGIGKTCEQALATAEEQAGKTMKSAVVNIKGDLVKSNTTSVHYTRENPSRPITTSEMDEITKQVQQKTTAIAEQAIALEAGVKHIEIRPITTSIIALTIDGRHIDDPIGQKGTDVTLEFYTCHAPLVYLDQLEKLCHDLKLEITAIAAEPFAVARAALDHDDASHFSGIILDIGSQTTNVVIIEHGIIKNTTTFAVGADGATASIKAWLAGIEVALENSNLDHLPSHIYLCGGGANLDTIQSTLALSNWYQKFPFTRRPLVDFLNLPDFPNLDPIYVTAAGLLAIGRD